VHVDLNVRVLDDEVGRLVGLGGVKTEEHVAASGKAWVVMRDPEATSSASSASIQEDPLSQASALVNTADDARAPVSASSPGIELRGPGGLARGAG
jgi:hypothetical protein